MATKKNPCARKTEVVVQELKGEVLIYDLQNNKAYCLNETSAFIYGLCDGNNSVADISNQLSGKLSQTVSEDLVWLAIDQLKQDNLLENSNEIESTFNGLSRRETIRKIGFASLIALPMISSLVAPTAAMAQSSSAGASCTVGTCIAPGNDICAGCTGRTITFKYYTSGVGCAGGGFDSGITCTGAAFPNTTTFPAGITSVT